MTARIAVLFVSRRNSLRSILAQACLAHLSPDRFSALSCGQPGHIAQVLHPAAVGALRSANIPVPGIMPRGWDELARAGSPRAHFVITLDETTLPFQPAWPGQPDAALWAFQDAAALEDPEASARAALQALYALRRRMELLVSLPLHAADPTAIRSDLRDMAHMR